MIERQLKQQLDKVGWRFRRLALLVVLTIIWAAVTATAAFILAMNHRSGWYFDSAFVVLTASAVVLTILGVWFALRQARNYPWVAQKIEAAYPELDSCLLAAVEQEPQLPGGQFGFMQQSVIRQAIYHGYGRNWQRVIPAWRTMLAFGANVASVILLAVVMSGFANYAPPVNGENNVALNNDEASSSNETTYQVKVHPGNTEIERGTSLLVTARFTGALPPDASLVFQPTYEEPIRAGTEPKQSLDHSIFDSSDRKPVFEDDQFSLVEMSKSLSDPVFGGRIQSVDHAITYHVAYADQKSDTFTVGVFEYPRLNRADAELVYPKYTSLEKRLVQDIRQVSAIEGTELTLICYLNKPVAEAKLIGRDGEEIELTVAEVAKTSDDDSNTPRSLGDFGYKMTITMDRSRRMELHLVDDAGRANKQPPEIVINVLPNKPPDLKLVQPSRDVQVSPIEELQLQANAYDDYGLSRIGVSYMIPGSQAKDVVLAQQIAGKERVDVNHLVAFEELDAEPDQLLSYHFWAEDAGPDGQPRRTSSDMYFAEVRHFEEIFRQGQQPPGGSQQQQQQGGVPQEVQKLTELQKQIINATWKIARREISATPSDSFAADTKLLVESQTAALEQATALAEKLQDAQSKQFIVDVQKHMQEAIEHLTEANAGKAIDPLKPGLGSEQAAYQALLKLRAREYQVMKASQQQQQSSSSSGSQSNRSQQQLQQLELKNDENRYEQQRTAQPKQLAEDRETRQVLNRLRELARRQGDLNKRIKELQSALEGAKTEAEREDIKRQLKRLRDEQQEILRDTDELKSRTEEPQNQERMADAQQQLDKARENARQSAEALKEGLVTQAAASGTRAEREFEELRDEFRKKASGRFNEEMKQMRQQAKELDDKEKELADKLADLTMPKEKSNSLRDPEDNSADQIREDIQKQKQDLNDLLDRVRQTVEDAEQSEPLLAEQLYDTFRETKQKGVERALDSTDLSLRRGLAEDAQNQEKLARSGIGELRKGIEKAAESVLGGETEALRRAHDELKNLSDELGDEVAQADPRQTDGSQQDPSQDGGQNNKLGENREPQPGEQPSKSQQPGQPNSSQGQPQNRLDGLDQFLNEASRSLAPIGGEDFVEWADRLRDVEEMLDDPELSSEVARIRDRARGMRIEMQRHSKEPNWDLVRMQVLEPLNELRDRVAEELLQRIAKDAVVPIDRDPVPPKYAEQVRKYYERLGKGR